MGWNRAEKGGKEPENTTVRIRHKRAVKVTRVKNRVFMRNTSFSVKNCPFQEIGGTWNITFLTPGQRGGGALNYKDTEKAAHVVPP